MLTIRSNVQAILYAELLLVIAATLVGLESLRLTSGHLTYPLDDAYTRMAIARHWIASGVWGVSAGHFSSSSSSPLWPAVLAAGYRLVGVRDVVPFFMNLLCAGAVVAIAGQALVTSGASPTYAFLGLVALVFGTPLSSLAWTGMEHTLHALCAISTMWGCSVCVRQSRARARLAVWLLVAAAATTATRYEGTFVIAGCSLVLILARRVRVAAALAVAGAAPIFIVGAINLYHGWWFIPAPILLNQAYLQSRPDLDALRDALVNYHVIIGVPALTGLAVMAAALLAADALSDRWTVRLDVVRPELLVVFLATWVLHTRFANFGQMGRYEAYLVSMGIVAVGVSGQQVPAALTAGVRQRELSWIVVGACAILSCLPLVRRAWVTPSRTALATRDVYDQQVPVARFVSRYYDHAPIAIGEIGVVGYQTEADMLDVVGYSSRDVAASVFAGQYDRSAVAALADAHHVQVAFIYPDVFATFLPAAWHPVATWTVHGKVVEGEHTAAVTIYAVTPEGAERLAAETRAFARELPPRVQVGSTAPR